MTSSNRPHRSPIPNLCLILLVTLLATSRSGVSAQRCSVGFYSNMGVCQPCEPGTFKSFRGPNMCSKCGAGTFYPFLGGTNSEHCAKCPPGTFSGERAATCKKCTPGLHAITGAQKCTKCEPGKSLSDFYEVSCSQCQSGYFNDGSSVLCQKCPSSTFSNKKSTGCTKCPKGTQKDVRLIPFFRVRTCIKCTEGTYADTEGMEQCKLCPPGTSSPKRASKCTSCAAGYYLLSPFHKTCRKCPKGTTSLGKRPAGCMRPENGCPQNTFEDDGECRACSPGERLNVSSMTCVPCGENEVSDGGDVQECVKCRSDQYPASARTVFEKSVCYCKPGYQDDKHGNCVKCHKGSWWNDDSNAHLFDSLRKNYSYFNKGRCQPCPGMTYSDKSGAIECKRCEIGLVSGIGATKCRKCPKAHVPKVLFPDEIDNNWVPFAEARCYSVKHRCDFGEVMVGGRGCVTSFCPEGALKRARRFLQGCINCGREEYLNANGIECTRCAEGTGNVGRHVKTSCQKCSGKGELAPGCLCPPSRVMVDGVCKKYRNGLVAFHGEYRTRLCRKGLVPDAKGNCRKCGPTAIRKNVNDTFCTPCGEGMKAGRDLIFTRNDKCVPM